MKNFDTKDIPKVAASFWCCDLMIRKNCVNTSQLEKVIEDLFDSQKKRSSNKYYKHWMALCAPLPKLVAYCEKKVSDSAWLINNPLWRVIYLESIDNKLAFHYLSQLNIPYLNNVKKDWYLSSNLYRDSFTDKLLRFTTLESLTVLVILIKLAHQRGNQAQEVRIAKQLYRGLLMIGAQIWEKNSLLETFFYLFDEFVFKQINWGDKKPVMDFPFYRFGVQYLNMLYPAKENIGFTLANKDDKQYIRDRCEFLLPGLLNLQSRSTIESLNFMLMPKDIENRKISDCDNLKSYISVWLGDLTAMHYSFEDNSISNYRDEYLYMELSDFFD